MLQPGNDLLTFAILTLLGIATGTIGALLGTGGGVFLIPGLIVLFGVPIRYAVGTSLLSVIATSTAVASANVDRGTANMRLGMTLEVATALGAITGGLSAHWLPAHVLETIFAFILLPTAAMMWRKREDDSQTASASPTNSSLSDRLGAEFDDPATAQHVVYRVRRLWAGLSIAFVAGILSGLLGIGGGVFKVPAIHVLCSVPIKAAAATSNFMIGVTAAASAFLYFGRGEVHPFITAAIVLGIVVGSAVGTYLNRFLGGIALKRLFALLLIAVSAQMFIRSVRG